jgi:hypothetical protein
MVKASTPAVIAASSQPCNPAIGSAISCQTPQNWRYLMKRKITEKALDSVIYLYLQERNKMVKAEGKAFHRYNYSLTKIIETFALLTSQTWINAQVMLDQRANHIAEVEKK